MNHYSEQEMYHVVAYKEGRWWLVKVPQLGAVGQAPKLADVPVAAEEVIALMTDKELGEFGINITIELPDDISMQWRQAKELEAKARRDQIRAAEKAREAVLALKERGFSQREVAQSLDISPQRVNQLIKEKTAV